MLDISHGIAKLDGPPVKPFKVWLQWDRNIACIITLQVCQYRPSDNKKWSLGSYKSAKFVVDSQSGLYLQYTGGTDKR